MYRRIPKMLIAMCLLATASAQSVVYQVKRNTGSLSEDDLARRIFDGERKTIALFAKRNPIVETYAQSLNPEQAPQAIIDDAYLLRRVSLDADSPSGRMRQSFAFGRMVRSRMIKMNNGDRWPLYPEGYVDMLFADHTAFDQDHYTLKYETTVMLGDTECLRLAVAPIEPKWSGQFAGTIWVETNRFRIVRLEGTFTPKRPTFFAKYLNVRGFSTLGIYLHFDSWRQEVAPGIWMPAYSYFDDARLWNDGKFATSYHLRGHTWVWGYTEGVDKGKPSPAQAATDPLSRLQDAGLIASPGVVEHWLENIVQDVQMAGHIAGPEIYCRILMTSPVEMFSVGNTVVISRGLLNIVPDQLILTGLLARQIAQMTLKLGSTKPLKSIPIFDTRRISDFAGFGGRHTAGKVSAMHNLMAERLSSTQFAAAVLSADRFVGSLAAASSQTPHLLLRTGFGFGLVERKRSGRPADSTSVTLTTALVLRADYGLNSWLDQVTISNEESHSRWAAQGSASIDSSASSVTQ
jgi:hypothetical protein